MLQLFAATERFLILTKCSHPQIDSLRCRFFVELPLPFAYAGRVVGMPKSEREREGAGGAASSVPFPRSFFFLSCDASNKTMLPTLSLIALIFCEYTWFLRVH